MRLPPIRTRSPGSPPTRAPPSPSGSTSPASPGSTDRHPASPDREEPAGESAEQRARHHQSLDLVGALVDLGDLRVAHHPLHREVAGVPGPAEQLYGVDGHLHRNV